MTEFRSMVVVGVDGSLEAAEAARFAAQAASVRDLDLLVVHAFSLPLAAETPAEQLGASARYAAQRVADDTLSQVRLPAGLHVYTEIELTTPGALLLRLSRRAALVAVGQHVFDIADRLGDGSVVSPLAAQAHCPVIVVPRGWSRTARWARTVAMALVGTSDAEAVLEFALAEAQRHRSPVVCLHVIPQGEQAEAAAADQHSLAEIIGSAKKSYPDLTVTVTLVTGAVTQAVLNASSGMRLMVLGRSPKTTLETKGRRSLSQAALANAHCPLVIVG